MPTLTLDRESEYFMVMVSRVEDSRDLGILPLLHAADCHPVACMNCGEDCLCSEAVLLMSGPNVLYICIRCSPEVADMMDNLDAPAKQSFRRLAREYESSIREHRRKNSGR